MAEYIYDLGTDSRYVLDEYIRPLNAVPIIHGSDELCCADLSVTGIVVMDLPPFIAEELHANRARILAWSQSEPIRLVGAEIQSKKITHFQIVA